MNTQPNQVRLEKRAQRNSQTRTNAIPPAAVPSKTVESSRSRSMLHPPTNLDPQGRPLATTKRGSRAATGSSRLNPAAAICRSNTSMLPKFQTSLALAQRKLSEQMRRLKSSSSSPPRLQVPPASAVHIPQQSAATLSAPPHIRALSGKDYAAISMMRSAAATTMHNPLLVSRALDSVVAPHDQQGPSRSPTAKRGTNSSGKGKRPLLTDEEITQNPKNVIILDEDEESNNPSPISCKKMRRVRKMSDAQENTSKSSSSSSSMVLQMIMPPLQPPPGIDGVDEKTVEGFIYDNEKEKEGSISIACNCHGIFHTPAEFVKHAGGTTNVFNPMKRITITVTQLPI